ncbi:MAG: MltA domain-containing protein, partial [Deltaproteobacteria bacterium]|nr:MltA domain-containing protein [Deltaproteobacteria bacterium]
MLRPLLALALIVAVSGCSTLEAPFRYAGMDQKTLKSTSVSSLPTDFAFDDLLSAPEKYGTERAHLLAAVDRSLAYLRSPGAAKVYRSRSQPPFSQEHVTLSLERFRTLLLETHTAIELRDVVRKEFMFFRSAGQESTPGETLFTGYCEPMFAASRVPTSEFRFPLFLRPADFPKWEKPHPTRTQLEGHRGLGGPGTLLNGAELLYLRDRFDVFFIQVQGSSKLRLPDGQLVSVAFHGATEYPFTSVASLLIRDGKMRRDQASMTRLRNYFKNNPAEFDHYLSKNNRFIFFRLLPQHMTPRGSLDTVVTSERSIATDKSVFPPGALALMQVELPKRN